MNKQELQKQKTEFETIFKLLCANPERPLSIEQLKDKRNLFWIKFGKLDKNIFFDACMSWIDKSKFMPSVNQVQEIIDCQGSANEEPVNLPVYVPKDNWKRRNEIREQCKQAVVNGKAKSLINPANHKSSSH